MIDAAATPLLALGGSSSCGYGGGCVVMAEAAGYAARRVLATALAVTAKKAVFLHAATKSVQRDVLVVAIDGNAAIGTKSSGDWGEAKPCVGNHGLPYVNPSGERMRNYMLTRELESELFAVSTFFKAKKRSRYVTWRRHNPNFLEQAHGRKNRTVRWQGGSGCSRVMVPKGLVGTAHERGYLTETDFHYFEWYDGQDEDVKNLGKQALFALYRNWLYFQFPGALIRPVPQNLT
jgi:hypothetical protein